MAELKDKLDKIGVKIPASVIEYQELLDFYERECRVKQMQQMQLEHEQRHQKEKRAPAPLLHHSDGTPESPKSTTSPKRSHPTTPSGEQSLPSPTKTVRSVSELKGRLKELGFTVPTSVVMKSELEDLVSEAERQAAEQRPIGPVAPPKRSLADEVRERLLALGTAAPVGASTEELQRLLREAEERHPLQRHELQLSSEVTATCTVGGHGVARIELQGDIAPSGVNFGSKTAIVHGAHFSWVRGDCIGRGASGTVYKALNQATGQVMAVKEVHMDVQHRNDQRLKEALEGEIEVMKALRHPNIVAYYGCDFIESSIFMYLEYMGGGSFARVLDEFGPFEESLISEYSRQLLNGLEYLHTRNPYVVHRDIKGANVLLGVDTVKLADFGCSKREHETRSLTIGGSIPWMAPEVIAHSRYGRAGDIWSFGCLLVEMVTAKTPWGDFDNIMAAMIKIGMSSELPAIPESSSLMFKNFVRRCLNRDPGRRLSASELLNERFVCCGARLSCLSSGDSDLWLDTIIEDVGKVESPGPSPKEQEASTQEPTDVKPLPEGWEKHFDEGYVEWYYWHRISGRSSWERPTAGGEITSPAPG